MGSWGLFTMLRRLTKVTTKLNSSFEIQPYRESKFLLELVCCVRNGKKSPNQEAGLGNRGPMGARNDKILILND